MPLTTIQNKIRDRITTNSNSSQRPNKSIIQNLKNWKLLEPSKYKKTTKFGQNKFLKINDYEEPTKKEERKKKATFQSPFFLFLAFILRNISVLITNFSFSTLKRVVQEYRNVGVLFFTYFLLIGEGDAGEYFFTDYKNCLRYALA